MSNENVLKSEMFRDLIDWVAKTLHASETEFGETNAKLRIKKRDPKRALKDLRNAVTSYFAKKRSRRERARNQAAAPERTHRRSRRPREAYST